MATLKINLEGDYLVLPRLTSLLSYPQQQSRDESLSTSPSMTMTSPGRTLSFGAASDISTMPSTHTSTRSSLDLDPSSPSSNDQDSSLSTVKTTTLKGSVTLNLAKPTKVASLAISLNGSTHVAFLGTGKRSHYSRHHVRTQLFLIEPQPATDGYTLLTKDTITYPFSIEIPNNLPPTVVTPQGGTIYRVTAVLTVAKSAGLMSFLSSNTTFAASSVVQIYRAPRSRCLQAQPGADIEDHEVEAAREENWEDQPLMARPSQGETLLEEHSPVNVIDMMPANVTHTWPGQLETKVSLPFTMLPPKSKPDLHVRVRVLREDLSIKSFQAALWERAVFKVQKPDTPANSKKHVIGVRDRLISAQRCDAGWVNDAITNQVPHTFEKIVLFTIPSALRKHNEMTNTRSCNGTTITHPQGLAHQRRQGQGKQPKEDKEIKDSEFGEIFIEIQHFLRFSVFVTGSVDSKGKIVSQPVERNIGDIPVVVRAFPSGPECDLTGLPSYLHSFSTSRISYEEARDYELEATGGLGFGLDSNNPNGERGLPDVPGFEGEAGPIYGDYENDDAFMAIMGYRGSRTPPSYEDSLGRPSLDSTLSELHGNSVSGPTSSKYDR